MNTEEKLLEAVTAQTSLLARVVGLLDKISQQLESANVEAPDLYYLLSEFRSFDWKKIGAEVIASDDDGPTSVKWRGRTFARRSPNNKYGEAIWFSRKTGTAPNGDTTYERLITFKQPTEADPLPRKVTAAIADSGNKPPAKTATTPGATGENGLSVVEHWKLAVKNASATPEDIKAALGVDRVSVWLEADPERNINGAVMVLIKYMQAKRPAQTA